MENYFLPQMNEQQLLAMSNLSLAHMGDCVFELLCRSWLCAQGHTNAGQLHKKTVELVKAPSQAQMVPALLPLLTPQELAAYRRGKNAHVHAVPKGATAQEYALATGLEALFGWLFLSGQSQRANQLFVAGMEARHGL